MAPKATEAVSSPTNRWYGVASRSVSRPCGRVSVTGSPACTRVAQRAPGPPAGWFRTHRSRRAEAAQSRFAGVGEAAAPPDHPYRIRHRHLLAYFLTKAGRYAE